MPLPWCKKCKNNCKRDGYMNSSCLSCRWQYVGQEVFDHKKDLFIDDPEISSFPTPYDYFRSSIEYAGVEII